MHLGRLYKVSDGILIAFFVVVEPLMLICVFVLRFRTWSIFGWFSGSWLVWFWIHISDVRVVLELRNDRTNLNLGPRELEILDLFRERRCTSHSLYNSLLLAPTLRPHSLSKSSSSKLSYRSRSTDDAFDGATSIIRGRHILYCDFGWLPSPRNKSIFYPHYYPSSHSDFRLWQPIPFQTIILPPIAPSMKMRLSDHLTAEAYPGESALP